MSVKSINAQVTDNFSTYYDPINGIRMNYPAEWEELVGQGLLDKVMSERVGAVAMFTPPDKFVYVLLAVEQLESGASLAQEVNDTMAHIRKDMPNFKILESEEVTFAGLSGHKIVGEGKKSLWRKIGHYCMVSDIYYNLKYHIYSRRNRK
jgi:hypothetical protein